MSSFDNNEGKASNVQLTTAELKYIFTLADKDNNGYVDRKLNIIYRIYFIFIKKRSFFIILGAELVKILEMYGVKMSKAESRMTFALFDVNGDNKIDFQEFCNGFNEALNMK